MRRVFLGLVFAGIVWLVGFAAFIAAMPEPSTADAPGGNDAVVVYTGGGGARIVAGMGLLADGAGARLLISGVNRETSRESIAALWRGEPDLFDCCVDLGFEARTTIGNAGEAARWARAQNAKRLILVTSDYHMPRAMAESRAQMPDAIITPYVVASGYLDAAGRPIHRRAWRALAGEYSKYLVAKAKALLAPLTR